MSVPKALAQPRSLKIASASFLAFWCLLAAFPIFWITVLSFKEPIDSFSANPFHVLFGPVTLSKGKGLSLVDIIVGIAVLYFAVRVAIVPLRRAVERFTPKGFLAFGWIFGSMLFALGFIIVFLGILPAVTDLLN